MQKIEALGFALKSIVEEQMARAHVPGMAVGIVEGDELVLAFGCGVTGVEAPGLAVKPETLFRIGSVTKCLVGTAVMRLVEAGKLHLDKRVIEYIPWFTLSDPSAAKRLTLRMLLNHTSGILVEVNDQDFDGSRQWNALEAYVRNVIPRYRLVAPPGKIYVYGEGIVIAAYLAEVVTGTRFSQLMQDLVFDPIEMERTTFEPSSAERFSVARIHVAAESGRMRVDDRVRDNVALRPVGFAFSNICDLSKFITVHINHGRYHGQQILSPTTVATMHSVQAQLYALDNTNHGLAFFIGQRNGRKSIWHRGNYLSCCCKIEMVPESRIGVITFSNWFLSDSAIDSIHEFVFSRLLDTATHVYVRNDVLPDRSLWPRFAGTYLGHLRGLVTIKIVQDQLVMLRHGEEIPLRPLSSYQYVGQRTGGEEPVAIGFCPEETGPIEYVQVNVSPCKRVQLIESRYPDETTMQRYVGTYRSPMATIKVRIEDHKLIVHYDRRNKEYVFDALDEITFVGRIGTIVFECNGDVAEIARFRDVWILRRIEDNFSGLDETTAESQR